MDHRLRDHLQGLHWECFVCGPDNRRGLRLLIRAVGEGCETVFVPTADLQGPPGITHSGITTAVLDEVMSQLVFTRLRPAVTRKVEVTFRRPMRVGVPYRVVAEITGENRHIITARAEARDPQGVQVARARGVYAPLDEERRIRLLEAPTGAGGSAEPEGEG